MAILPDLGSQRGSASLLALTIYIFRYGEGTVMAIMHPDNSVAKKSVGRYMSAMKTVSAQVADSGHWGRVA